MRKDSELTPVSRPCGLYRELIKSEIKKILLSEDILVEILIDWYGQPTFTTLSWQKYWEPVIPLLSPIGHNIVENLREARRQYIQTKFSHQTRISYCFNYFCLLEEVLKVQKNGCDETAKLTLLGKVLGFENFVIRWINGEHGAACSTSTIRNPCYLLSKIKQPQAKDDPKFIALITGPNVAHSDAARIYYHYRQYKIDNEFGISLLLCPATSLSERANSFTLIESLTSGFSDKTDPRSKQRSQILADLAILPFLTKLFSKIGAEAGYEVNFVDIGSGNGALVSNIWRQILKTQPDIVKSCKLACSMVGLRVQNPLRHFNKGLLRGSISYLDYHQSDYLQWLQEQKLTQGSYKFDVSLLCRLLNNLSEFKLNFSSDWRIIHILGEDELSKTSWMDRRFLPHNCLSPENLSIKNIYLKNTNVSLENGKSFKHLSLSDYYKGLQLLNSKSDSNVINADTIYYPIRQFNPMSIKLPDGKSALEKLCNLSKLVVIEDVDLTKEDLIQHLIENNLENIAAANINRHNRLNSASIFCLCNKEFADLLPGKKIWPDLLEKIGYRASLRLRSFAASRKSRQSI
ncbi:MAG: hypothetical protein ABSB91_06390 [Sedimentisphaerales bacterium]